MDLIVISSPTVVDDESTIINNLFQAGLKYFHVRKRDNDINMVRQLLNRIAPQFHARISLHQFHQIANEYGIQRLHYTGQARMLSNAQKWQVQAKEGFTLSTSVHDITALHTLAHFDYAFYGPVFNSISKPGYQSTLPANFKLDRSNIKTKVIALGGVDGSNLTKVRAMGFDGAAILGTIWNDPDKAISHFTELKESLPV
ncbi:thiamine phosphate synthase [Mucilaginibacter sp.]|jgi:thiamine-phosphate pyrophosphorylase|uniref:thiamine phosphate synthase n=1 Tax=Mucilaginibacter sp. TaxID=1882438 RepID=UPI0035689A64